MAAVTRPPATVDEQPTSAAPAWASDFAQHAKWIVLAAIVLAVVALIMVIVATVSEKSRVTSLRTQWDKVYTALKGKESVEDQRIALEGVAEQVVGTPAHAYVLQRLGEIQFDTAVNPAKSPEDRTKALDRTIEIYKLLAENEPYASNRVFGPLGVQNLALAYEQKQDYDSAVKLLEERLPKLENHPMYFKMSAQLGRLYWLQSVKNNDAKLRTAAREKLTDVLRATADKSEGGLWREQAEYIRSMLDPRGKAIPEGTAIPAAKPMSEEEKAEANKEDIMSKIRQANPNLSVQPSPPPAPKAAPRVITPPVPPKAVTPTPTPAAPKTEPKKDEPKKEEPKKTGSLNETPAKAGVSASSGGQHTSFKQMMEMAKSGRMSFCLCPRCDVPGANKNGNPGVDGFNLPSLE